MPRWKLLRGVHSDRTAKPVSLEVQKGVEGRENTKEIAQTMREALRDFVLPEKERSPFAFYPGDVFDSDKNLMHLNAYIRGGEPISIRFAKVEGIAHQAPPPDPPQQPPKDGLADMSLAELREMAATEEIDLGDAKRKDEVLATIRGAAASV